MAKLEDIEGVGPAHAETLRTAGIGSVGGLLAEAATASARAALAEKTGLSGALILKWVNHADLFRITGVAGEYAELLEAAGVDSVPELAQRNPQNLTDALAAANETRTLVRRVPTADQVATWVAEAKTLERAVHH